VQCDDFEPLIEAIADGAHELSATAAAHLASCRRCAAALERARSIETLLAMREVAAPPPAFTAAVMARVGDERWKTERVIDLGFNLAIAAGVLVIVAGGTGLAWSLGFLNLTIDLDAVWSVLGSEVTGRFLSQVQTVGMAAVLLTMALVLWWWAEAAAE
jgi:hypothetical protein